MSVALLVPTGAFSAGGTDEVTDDLVLSPSDGPNGKYALLNSDDEIELLLSGANPSLEAEGLNDETVTPLDDVFTITYTGDEYARVWLTDDAEDVHFYRGDDPDDVIESRPNNVTVGPDETVRVGVLVDARGDDDVESVDEFTVHAELGDSDDGHSVNTAETDEERETDTPTATVTPTETPTATETATAGETETATAGAQTEATDGAPAATGTETETETETGATTESGAAEGSPASGDTTPSEPDAGDAGGPSELGGFSPVALTATAAMLGVLLLSLALYRYRGGR